MDTVRILTAGLGLALALVLAAPQARAQATSTSSTSAAECIDQELADRLAVKRKRRGLANRDFIKAQRHELSLTGGYYASDLFASTYIVGGAYTYHMTENAAVEASFAMTHADADVIRALEAGRGEVIDDTFSRVMFAASTLIWYPLHGKLRFGGTIVHFDLHLDLGVGVVDSETSRGAAGIGGMGIKFFLGSAGAVRIDVRDLVYRQELLDERFLVNDVSITAGVSLFLPTRF